MSYKVLEQNGVTNENVDGAGFNYFAVGKRDGILGGILNECAVYSPASNIVSIKTGVISVQGFRVKITSDISWAASGNADEYSIVFEIVLNPDRSVSSQFIAQPSSLTLVKDDLLASEKGTHQIEVIRFNWDGDAVSNISRRLPVIIAGSGSGGSIELAQSLSGNEEDKAPSVKAVNEGLAGKVDKVKKTSGIHVYTSETDGQRTRQAVNNPNPYMIALYDGDKILKTATPKVDLDCTNKRYVDNKCRDLQQGVYNALGVQYITVEDESDALNPSVPENAMRFACIESVGYAVACAEDGTEIGSVDVLVTANYAPVDTTNLPVYVDMGDDLNLHYELPYGAPDGTFYVKATGRKIIYQVKVGG